MRHFPRHEFKATTKINSFSLKVFDFLREDDYFNYKLEGI